jgi:hypothetical protein
MSAAILAGISATVLLLLLMVLLAEVVTPRFWGRSGGSTIPK